MACAQATCYNMSSRGQWAVFGPSNAPYANATLDFGATVITTSLVGGGLACVLARRFSSHWSAGHVRHAQAGAHGVFRVLRFWDCFRVLGI